MTAKPILTWLFVPGDRPDRVEKAIASRAHAVVVDLEDGVPPERKETARASVAVQLAQRFEKPIFVRVNAHDERDIALVRELPVAGAFVPKVEHASDLPDGFELHAMIESALGLENAFAIAAHPSVRGVALGEADLRSQTGALESGVDWARARIVNAAVAAGLPRPPQAVYMDVRDLGGLARSCARGRELGHNGRQAIHPHQLEVIEQAYLPTEAEAETARMTVETLERAGTGVVAGRTFVDAAMFGAARGVLALVEAYGTRS